MKDPRNTFLLPALALVGLAVLISDISADYAFFQDPTLRTTALVGSAIVRNALTLTAVVALFYRKTWAAYLLVAAALLGGWRRLSLLLPLAAPGHTDQWVLVHSGLDIGFRCLILGVGLGYLIAQFSKGEAK